MREISAKSLSQFEITSPTPEGILAPGETLFLPLEIRAKGLGLLQEMLSVEIQGSKQPISVPVIGQGVGPVVVADPVSVDFGLIEALKPTSVQIKLSNEALIPSQVDISFQKDKKIWSVDQNQLIIPAEGSVFVKFTAVVDDVIEFRDQMLIKVNNGNRLEIPVRAVGTGTTIVAMPSLNAIPGNGIDLGSCFSTVKVNREVKFVNRGRRHQHVIWSVAGFERLSQRMINDQRQV